MDEDDLTRARAETPSVWDEGEYYTETSAFLAAETPRHGSLQVALQRYQSEYWHREGGFLGIGGTVERRKSEEHLALIVNNGAEVAEYLRVPLGYKRNRDIARDDLRIRYGAEKPDNGYVRPGNISDDQEALSVIDSLLVLQGLEI